MTATLPITVLLPTRNSRRFLAAHWAQLQTWADLVQEIIVVDSHSTDGTIEFINAQTCRPPVRLLQHPPGLYESWNFGLRQATAEYTYISTVGDTITAEGLRHLAAVATELRADVVVSRPEFFTQDGRPFPAKRWPVHEYLERSALAEPKVLQPMETFLLSLLNVPEGILGSSASNLYRTHTLQRLPFPTDYGHVGDTAWAIAHAFQATVAITPKIFSRFLLHPNGGQIPDDAMEVLKQRFFALGRRTLQHHAQLFPEGCGEFSLAPSEQEKAGVRGARKSTPHAPVQKGCGEFSLSPSEGERAGVRGAQAISQPQLTDLQARLTEFSDAVHEMRQLQDRYDDMRHRLWPWILNPLAWRARARRNAHRHQLRQTKETLYQQFALSSCSSGRQSAPSSSIPPLTPTTGHSNPAEPLPSGAGTACPRVPPPSTFNASTPDHSESLSLSSSGGEGRGEEAAPTHTHPVSSPSPVVAHSIHLTVLLCSHNPRPDHLTRVLQSLRAQTLAADNWELLLVDSASTPPLAGRFDLTWHPHAAVLREDQPGKTRAFLRGSARAAGSVLVIVDDDNVLAPDYLEQAGTIAAVYPDLGAWGGNVALEFEKPPPDWTRGYWTFLAQQTVTATSMVCNLELTQPLPVGAGCCVRKSVARQYAVRLATSPWLQALGPTGSQLLRGEDTDLVLTACELGLDRGLFPSLRLTHLIPPERLTEDYLTRLVEGIQFGGYVVEMSHHSHRAPPPTNWWWWLKFSCDCLTKFGRKRRFYLAGKRAQRQARALYKTVEALKR